MIRATSLHRHRVDVCLALVAATLMIVIALGQLFAYEDFPRVLSQGLSVTSSSVQVGLLSALLVVSEVAAVANFVDVPLSRLGRWCSRLCGLAVPIVWIIVMVAKKSDESAIFGAKVHLAVGVASYAYMIVLLGLAVALLVLDIRRQG